MALQYASYSISRQLGCTYTTTAHSQLQKGGQNILRESATAGLLLQHTRILLEKDRRRGLWKACSRRGTPPSSKSKILMETSAASVARHPEERALRRSWNVNLILVISHPPSFSKAVLGLCRSRPILPLRDPLFQFAHLRSACVEVTQSLKWYKVSSPRIH